MSAKKTLYLANILALCFLALDARTQNVNHLYKVAEREFYQEETREALTFYEKISAIDPNFKDVKYKTELCILLLGDADRPLDAILNYRDTRGRADKFYYYWLGKILDYRYQFDDAILAWEQFLKIRAYKSPEIVKETRSFIKRSRKKIELFENRNRFHVVKLGGEVNSSKPELAPTYVASSGQLLFASARGNSVEPAFNLFRVARYENEWSNRAKLSSFGQLSENEVSLVQNNESGKLFMYKERKGGNLYFSKLNNDRWTEPSEFDNKVIGHDLGSHFFINEHEDRIVFSSAKHAKKSGLDIYQSFKNAAGKWSKPVPFPTINSELDEDDPFLSADEKTLYFSSKGHDSMGGYDVFKSEFDEETQTWSQPVNLGYPVNTPDDEIQFRILPGENQGFFSSNRLKPLDDFDIYQFYEAEWTKIEGKVYDLLTKSALKEGEIEFVHKGFGKGTFTATIDSMGRYEVQVIAGRKYNINISDSAGFLQSDEFEVVSTGNPTLHIKNFYANGDFVNQGVSVLAQEISSDDPGRYQAFEKSSTPLDNLGSKYRVAPKAILHNIYFDFGTSVVRQDSKQAMDELYTVLSSHPKLRVEIAGHTDNVGTSDVNLKLSENRAKSIKKLLIELGISGSRLVAKGYGESRPFASNDNEVDGRELNRRIEVHVIQ